MSIKIIGSDHMYGLKYLNTFSECFSLESRCPVLGQFFQHVSSFNSQTSRSVINTDIFICHMPLAGMRERRIYSVCVCMRTFERVSARVCCEPDKGR